MKGRCHVQWKWNDREEVLSGISSKYVHDKDTYLTITLIRTLKNPDHLSRELLDLLPLIDGKAWLVVNLLACLVTSTEEAWEVRVAARTRGMSERSCRNVTISNLNDSSTDR